MSLGNAFNNLEDFANARGAASKICDIIDKQPLIDSSSDEGIKPDNLHGHVVFENAKFSYPARPDTVVKTNKFSWLWMLL